MTSHELTFGDASHLPDARALLDFSFQDNPDDSLELHPHIAFAPEEHPEVVARLQFSGEKGGEALCHDIALLGIRHFSYLRELGVVVPPHRFVIAPAPHDDTIPTLYSFTDKLSGRTVSDTAADRQYAAPLVNSLAGYMLKVYGISDQTGETQFLDDLNGPRQFTLHRGQAVLHDTSLHFGDTREGSDPSDNFVLAYHTLSTWANTQGIGSSEQQRALSKLAEPFSGRLLQRIVEGEPDYLET